MKKFSRILVGSVAALGVALVTQVSVAQMGDSASGSSPVMSGGTGTMMKSMTPDQKAQMLQQAWQSMTPEQQQAFKDKVKQKWDSMSPEQKKKLVEKISASMTPDQKQAFHEKMKEKWDSLTPEQQQAVISKMQEHWQHMSPEQKQEMMHKAQDMMSSSASDASGPSS